MVNETQNNVARQRIDEAFRTQAKHLNLSYLHITTLPREIGRLSNLESLNLSQNELSTLPREIGELYNLQRLDLSGNPLVELPPEIGNLSKLTHLRLFNCRLSNLPSEIGKLTNLIELDLFHNPLRSSSLDNRSGQFVTCAKPANDGNLGRTVTKGYRYGAIRRPTRVPSIRLRTRAHQGGRCPIRAH